MIYKLERDYDTEYMNVKIKKEIYECKKIPDSIKHSNNKLLYILFWIGIKLKEIGYNEKTAEKLIMKIVLKIKFSKNKWDIAYNYILRHKKKLENNL